MRSKEKSKGYLKPVGGVAAGVHHGVSSTHEKTVDHIKGLFNVYKSPLDHSKKPKPMPQPYPYTPGNQQQQTQGQPVLYEVTTSTTTVNLGNVTYRHVKNFNFCNLTGASSYWIRT